ncbi:serine hydrolase domain-containing protein [Paenibacillus lentus]|uniref:Class A beta-lactamase-related serine hydrolase n=1 Tax=Paenibacillus lentus TaxID=1338368 RepID=A0A3Q8SB16_9BACL|nr:serine hydrolase domain-containing protein [Paenibacillus lentus]AZK46634.1 class A beta-lactamase-related serine hydrolase [Paenibacillus lentus]
MGKFQHLDALLTDFTKTNLAGCACAVARNGEILYEGYHGFASLNKEIPVSSDTLFRLFSMTKVVVCTAALMLFERGRFLLNEPLHEYIPEYKDMQVVKIKPNGDTQIEGARNPILIKDAFCMTTGIPYPFGESESARQLRDLHQRLKDEHGKYSLLTEVKAVAQVPLAFEPGTQWLYGYSHDLVGALIEVISGKPLGQFLQEELFEPLEMTSTGYRFHGDLEARMAACYTRTDSGNLEEIPGPLDEHHQADSLYEGGGVGLYSTVRDYLAFTQMLANGGTWKGEQIIGRKTIDLMRTNHLNETQLADFKNDGYGYGLGVRTMMDPAAGHSNSSLGEFGWTGAAGTWASVDPSEGFSVVYMHQLFPNMEEYHHPRVRAAAYGCL